MQPGSNGVRRGVGPAVSAVLLLVLGGPVALFSSFVLAFASDACGLGGRGTFACSPTIQLVTYSLPLAGLGAGLVLSAVAFVMAGRGRDAGLWMLAAWSVLVFALIAGFGLGTSMGIAE